METMASDVPKWGREDFFLLIQTLPTFWAERIWLLIIFIFVILWTPNFWISRSPYFQISGFPGPQISKFPDLQIPRFPGSRFPDAAAACGRTLRSQPDPSPNAPRDQIRRKGPCCDMVMVRKLFRLYRPFEAFAHISTPLGNILSDHSGCMPE